MTGYNGVSGPSGYSGASGASGSYGSIKLNRLADQNQNVVSKGISTGTFTSDGFYSTASSATTTYTASSLLNNGAK